MKIFLFIAVMLLFCNRLFAESLPKNWRQALVSIEVVVPPQLRAAGVNAFQEVGTGFWITTDTVAPFRAILFTADHVLKEQCDAGIYEVQLRPDAPPTTRDSDVRRYPLKICNQQVVVDRAKGTVIVTAVPLWTKHPTADLAAIIPPMDANSPHIEITPMPSDLLPTEDDLKKWHVSEGDDVLALVYSPNISSERPSEALVRQGVISEFRERDDTFLVSLLIFPGNSGAPLFLKRSAIHVDFDSGAQFGAVNPLYLMGVLTQYISYQELAISPQTKHPRVMFEENSGLARVVSSGRIRELLNQMALPKRP